MNYNPATDAESKEPIPVYLFNRQVGEIELGLYVRWENAYESSSPGQMAPPLCGF